MFFQRSLAVDRATPLGRLAVGLRGVVALALATTLGATPPDELGSAANPSEPTPRALTWDAHAARHLLNRAAFGARPGAVERAVALGHAACVEELIAGQNAWYQPFFVDVHRPWAKELAPLSDAERQARRRTWRREDRRQMDGFRAWWVERMLESGHALRERMTLYWHGHFTGAYPKVRSSAAMIAQNELFRAQGLGRFDELLRAVLRDPALLIYLDATQSSPERPNENLARELLELFTLGEGCFTERDVSETARALSGWKQRQGVVRFQRARHDSGEKTILGQSGAFGPEDLVELILATDAAPRFLAQRLLAWFEGVAPSEERVAHYAALLVEHDWEIAAFLRELFLDPDFYAERVVGQRVAGPLDYLIGCAKRLDLAVDGRVIARASAALGQELGNPPSVSGWEGGLAWISTDSLQRRGNQLGLLLGVVERSDLMPPDAQADAQARLTRSYGWPRSKPRLNLSARLASAGVRRDRSIANALLALLLAVEPTREARVALREFVRREREALGIAQGALLQSPQRSEPLLRRAAHVIGSLPEAQLH